MVFVDMWRKRSAKKVAAEHGLELDLTPKQPAGGFSFYSPGTAQRMDRRMQRPGGRSAVFDYEYQEWGKNHEDEPEVSTERFTCVLIALPFSAPGTLIGRESITSKLAKMVGGPNDIEIGTPDFDKRHRVRSNDEAFVRTLLDPDVVAWMLAAERFGGSMIFELVGPRMLCAAKRRKISSHPELLDWGEGFADVVPAPVIERYPSSDL